MRYTLELQWCNKLYTEIDCVETWTLEGKEFTEKGKETLTYKHNIGNTEPSVLALRMPVLLS